MSLKDEQGQALIYALIFLIVGSLLMASLVPLLGAGFRRQFASREQVMAGYTAEAGVKRVIADLIRGADALSPHYTVPEITVNGHTPIIDIRAATIALPFEPIYVDPGVRDPALSVIHAGQGYLLRLHHVKAGELTVNWAFDGPPFPPGARLGIWRGLTPQGAGRIYAWPEHEAPLAMAQSEPGEDYTRVSVTITEPGIYTIVFFSERPRSRRTRLFGPGGDRNTWIYVRAHQDYIVTATAGGGSVSAFVRQVPGFSEPHFGDRGSWITNQVSVLSWRAP